MLYKSALCFDNASEMQEEIEVASVVQTQEVLQFVRRTEFCDYSVYFVNL